jgi:hypothetical protein
VFGDRSKEIHMTRPRLFVSVGALALLTVLATLPARAQIKPTDTKTKLTVPPPSILCDETPDLIKGDLPELPKDATEIEGPTLVDEDLGPVSSLYPGVDTTTDAMYPLPCDPSIGGTLPEVPEPTQAELDTTAFLNTITVPAQPPIKHKQQITWTEGKCYLKGPAASGTPGLSVDCNSPRFLDPTQPFEGRDVIYVHGLATGQLSDRLTNTSAHPSFKTWPANSGEFLNPTGYYRTYAENYWRSHIREHLFDPVTPSNPIAGWQYTSADPSPTYRPKKNRYLAVAWNSNQRLEFAQETFLFQVRAAITANTNVVTPPTFPSNQTRPFCSNGCVVVSHSTGGLIVGSALGRAASNAFGPAGKQVASHLLAHIAFASALTGSNIATAALAAATALYPNTGVQTIICSALDEFLASPNVCTGSLASLTNSVLVDLVPGRTRTVWGPWVAATTTPTVTLAGSYGQPGSPVKLLLPGLDDGVVSMNSACANPLPVASGVLVPSGMAVSSALKAFDFSENPAYFLRATQNLISALNFQGATPPAPKYLAMGCTPYVSPTGMVMPVAATFPGSVFDARKRITNHYSMVQGTPEHSAFGATAPHPWPSTSNAPASTPRDYKTSYSDNREEASAVTDGLIYRYLDTNNTHLVHPQFSNVHEIIRGRKVSFKLFGIKKTWWIWKRTYHLLDKWKEKSGSAYAYEFVARR